MIDPKAQQLSEQLIRRLERYQDRSPFYSVDGSWNSLELVDHKYKVLFGLGAQSADELGDESKALIKEIAAYLGIIAGRYWQEFGTFVSLQDRPGFGLVLKASGGEVLDTEGTHEVRIEKDLTDILIAKPEEIEVVPGFVRPVGPDDNILKLYSVGLFTGCSPLGRGDWEGEGALKLDSHLDSSKRIMASAVAAHYSRIFPGEQFGQVAELYLRKLIWPPINADEDSVASGGALGLADFFASFQVPVLSQVELLKNLICLGDEVSSNAAKVVFAGILQDFPTNEEIYLVRSHDRLNRILRPTLFLLRREEGEEEDWILKPHEEEHQLMFEVERNFGMLHWVKFSLNRVAARDENFGTMLQKLSFGELDSAFYELQKLIAEDPSDLELRTQRCYLLLEKGEGEKCESELRQLLTEPGAKEEARLFHLLGLSAFLMGSVEKSVEYLASSAAMPARDSFAAAELELDYARVLRASGDVEKAFMQLNKNLSKRDRHFAYFNDLELLSLFEQLGRFDELEELVNRMIQANPFHPAVLAAVDIL